MSASVEEFGGAETVALGGATLAEEFFALKASGNQAFKSGEYAAALELYVSALALASSDKEASAILHCSCSMCHAHLGNLPESISEAKLSLQFDGRYQKAHYRLVKSLMEANRLREARQYLLVALKDVGDTKELKTLEAEVDKVYGSPLRPKPGEFDTLAELGDGNFSKIFKACLKAAPERVFAIKVIELMTVERMQRRHRNINNEIHMEKRVLNKLDHPNIVSLHATFRDYGSLYYQMEYLAGGELFDRLHEHHGGLPYAVGLPQSLARFVLAQAINALEYMHRRGIVHRDIKPENMLFSASGHLKFVDFGTAKDLVQTDLNGPEFVGTPDYMSPLAVSSKECGPDSDIWALGVVLHQMITGSAPFSGASPYMAFLRIKRAMPRVSLWVSPELQSMLLTLMTRSAAERMAHATGLVDGSKAFKGGASINYDPLRKHGYFSYRHKDELATVEGFRSAHQRPAETIPRLSELCIRAVGSAALDVAAATAVAGGVRPEVAWMQSFDLLKISPLDRGAIAHYLDCRNSLHSHGVQRLFCQSLVDARCVRIDLSTREYIGFTRRQQSQWERNFFFVQLADPQLGIKAGMAESSSGSAGDGAYSGGNEWESELARLKQAVVGINRLRPRFVVVSGDLTHAAPGEPMYQSQVEVFRKTIARVSDSIPLLFMPGNHDIGNDPTVASLDAYRLRFGADYYGFWYGGLRCLVLNSTLMQNPAALPRETALQDEWFAEEIEQAKLSSTHCLIFTHHPWFLDNIDEDDSYWTIPKVTRHKWLRRLQHHKVPFAFAGHYHRSHGGGKSFPGATIKYKPKKTKTVDNDKNKDSNEDSDEDKNNDKEEKNQPGGGSGVPVEASSSMDVSLCETSNTEKEDANKEKEEKAGDSKSNSDGGGGGGGGDNDDDDDDDDDDDLSHGSEDDAEHDWGYTPEEREDDGRVAFKNVERDFQGPTVVVTNSVGLPLDDGPPGMRVILVREQKVIHQYYALDALPKEIDPESKTLP